MPGEGGGGGNAKVTRWARVVQGGQTSGDASLDLDKLSVALPEREQRYLADSTEAPRSARSKTDSSLLRPPPHPTPPLHNVLSITVTSLPHLSTPLTL